MYKALLSGATFGKSGAFYRFSAGQTISAPKGELDHDTAVIWIEPEVEVVEVKPKRTVKSRKK